MERSFTTIEPTQEGAVLLPGRHVWTSPQGLATITIDSVEFNFHADLCPGTSGTVAKEMLAAMLALGLEPLPEDECEPELLDSGWTRIYFTPVEPMLDDLSLIYGSELYIPEDWSTQPEGLAIVQPEPMKTKVIPIIPEQRCSKGRLIIVLAVAAFVAAPTHVWLSMVIAA